MRQLLRALEPPSSAIFLQRTGLFGLLLCSAALRRRKTWVQRTPAQSKGNMRLVERPAVGGGVGGSLVANAVAMRHEWMASEGLAQTAAVMIRKRHEDRKAKKEEEEGKCGCRLLQDEDAARQGSWALAEQYPYVLSLSRCKVEAGLETDGGMVGGMVEGGVEGQFLVEVKRSSRSVVIPLQRYSVVGVY